MERSRLTLLAVALATFMTYLDNNIINVAIPAIERRSYTSGWTCRSATASASVISGGT